MGLVKNPLSIPPEKLHDEATQAATSSDYCGTADVVGLSVRLKVALRAKYGSEIDRQADRGSMLNRAEAADSRDQCRECGRHRVFSPLQVDRAGCVQRINAAPAGWELDAWLDGLQGFLSIMIAS